MSATSQPPPTTPHPPAAGRFDELAAHLVAGVLREWVAQVYGPQVSLEGLPATTPIQTTVGLLLGLLARLQTEFSATLAHQAAVITPAPRLDTGPHRLLR